MIPDDAVERLMDSIRPLEMLVRKRVLRNGKSLHLKDMDILLILKLAKFQWPLVAEMAVLE